MTNSAALNRTLSLEDNLLVLRGLDSESIDLIATDPPFNKGVGAFEGTTRVGVDVEFKDAMKSNKLTLHDMRRARVEDGCRDAEWWEGEKRK